jgi:hypothetical protein
MAGMGLLPVQGPQLTVTSTGPHVTSLRPVSSASCQQAALPGLLTLGHLLPRPGIWGTEAWTHIHPSKHDPRLSSA